MPFASDWLYRRLGHRYFWAYVAFEVISAYLTCAATIGLFALYIPDFSSADLVLVVVVAEIAVTTALAWSMSRAKEFAAPLIEWVKTGKPASGAESAWRVAAALPREFVVRNGWQPFVIISVPVAVFSVLLFDLPAYTALFIIAGIWVAVAYAAVLHFFASELALRPVMRDAVAKLPPDFAGERVGVPLRWKLLGALPLINVITGVVVSGLSHNGDATLSDLGVDVLVAIAVAFTVSLELTLLLTKSVLSPVEDLTKATGQVKAGDLSARVPVLSGDELGDLAGGFNEMVSGLEERERLREALGFYLDPEVAERVARDGAILEGEDVEVSVLFVDIRDFTPFAERASAREAVTRLNDFFGVVVPILRKHGGHANKFVGDGVLGVFGAPERHRDHADRGLAAACEIAAAVERSMGAVQVGIGVNSGPVLVGSIGGGGRLDFTVIGDPVNVAARVERATRETGDIILITEATRCLLTGAPADLEPRGERPLKGKSEDVALWAVPVGASMGGPRPTGAAVSMLSREPG
jgi:class 3 adenylate cyclase